MSVAPPHPLAPHPSLPTLSSAPPLLTSSPHPPTLPLSAAYILETNAAATDPTVSVSVRPNDLAFTVHALLMTCAVIAQCFLYTRTSTPRISPLHRYVLVGIWSCLAFTTLLALTSSIPFACVTPACPATHLTLLSTLGLTKVLINLIKNLPQLLLNHSRQSTLGWSIAGVLTDLVGASAAFVQQSLDVWNQDDWGMMVGNVPKFLLSVLSFGFDMAFVVQHFVCYRGMNREEEKGEGEGEGETEEGGEEGQVEDVREGASTDWMDEEKEKQEAVKAKKHRGKAAWAGNGEYLLHDQHHGSVNGHTIGEQQ